MEKLSIREKQDLREDLEDIISELDRAIGKHGWLNTPLNPIKSGEHHLKILVEEVGEVANSLTYDGKSDEKTECLQVAAMAFSRYFALKHMETHDADRG